MRLARFALRGALPLLLITWNGIATAQVGTGQIGPPASPIERMQPPTQPEVAPPEAPPPVAAPEEGGPPVHVTGIAIDGATVYPAARLAAYFASLDGATVPRNRIAEAVRSLQTKYREDGYFLTVVRDTIEPAPEGVLVRVQVIEGYISDVKIDGEVGPAGLLVYDFLRHLTEHRPTKLGDVERYVLLAKNVPGTTIRTILRPARNEPGAVELIAQIEKKTFDLLLTDDNRGPRTAGPNEMLLAGNINSLTSLGERTQLFVYDTAFDAEQVFGQLAYETFIGSEGLKFRGYIGYGTSTPGNVLALTGYHSNLLVAGGSFEYPLILSRSLSLSLKAELDWNQSQIGLLASNGLIEPVSKVRLRILRVSESLTVQDDLLGFGRSAANTLDLTAHRGLPELVGSINTAPFIPRPAERNDFYKFTGEAVRVQNLFVWSTYSVALKTAITGQWTPAILPPTEKFELGGEQYGRGFYSGEVNGDKAVAGTIEPQLNQTLDGEVFGYSYDISTQYYAFFDIGQIWSNALADPTTHIQSTGAGIRANLTSWLSAQVEGVERFTRRPNATTGPRELEHAAYFRVTVHL